MFQIISPHLDDGPLSMAGTMRHWIDSGHEVRVINVFSRSGFTPDAADVRSGFRNLERVTALRRAEEHAVQREIGYATEFLDLLDGALRGKRGSLYAMLRYGRVPARPSRTRATIVGELCRLLEPGATTVFPLGVGSWKHPDHLLVADIGRELWELGNQIEFYEDLPYALHDPDLAASLPKGRASPTLTPVDLAWKTDILRLYESQVSDEMLRDLESYSTRIGEGQPVERRWRIEA